MPEGEEGHLQVKQRRPLSLGLVRVPGGAQLHRTAPYVSDNDVLHCQTLPGSLRVMSEKASRGCVTNKLVALFSGSSNARADRSRPSLLPLYRSP